jgi:hypothetical protein
MKTNGMSTAPTSEEVLISTLVQDPNFQVRKKLDSQTVSRYAAAYSAGRPMPPIKVALIEDARVVVDGWHRLAALEKIGRCKVQAEIVKATAREALWLAAQANLQHGLPLKSPEVRAAFRAYIKAQQHRGPRGNLKSYRQIAQELGGLRRYTTIRNWMKRDFRKIFDAMGGDEPLGETGGLRDVPVVDFATTAKKALDEALAASKGVTSPAARCELVEHAKQVLKAIETGGPWEESEEPDF